MVLNEAFWGNKYKSGKTGWDIGSILTPLKKYLCCGYLLNSIN